MEFSSKQRLDILASLARGKKVLDIGCVDHEVGGRDAKSEWFAHARIAQTAASVTGLDYDKEGVREMCEMGFDAVHANAENFDLGEKYDIVTAGEVLEHIPNHRGALNSIRRHLAADGKLVVTVPNSGGIFYLACSLVYGHETDGWDHTCMFTPVTISVLLKKCGFRAKRIILCQPFGGSYDHKVLWMKIAAAAGNFVYRIACMLRMCFARYLIVVAEPCDDEQNTAPTASAER